MISFPGKKQINAKYNKENRESKQSPNFHFSITGRQLHKFQYILFNLTLYLNHAE